MVEATYIFFNTGGEGLTYCFKGLLPAFLIKDFFLYTFPRLLSRAHQHEAHPLICEPSIQVFISPDGKPTKNGRSKNRPL